MKNLQFILHENVDSLVLRESPVSTLGYKFEIGGEQYGEYITIEKPFVEVADVIDGINQLAKTLVLAQENVKVEKACKREPIKKTSSQELKETVPYMLSGDYKERFKAEYQQTKIRYERLKAFNNKIEAAELMGIEAPKHDCPLSLLRDQQRAMGEYLHFLELRANIEGVDIN